MSSAHEVKVIGTLVARQGLTEVLEAVIAACENQAFLMRRFGILADKAEAERLALLWERCAGAVKMAAARPAVRELRRQLRDV